MSVQPAPPLLQQLTDATLRIREDIVHMCARSDGGHLGGAMSLVEILTSLYLTVMRADPTDPEWPDRDILILSKGHGAIGLYATLAEAGYFPRDWLERYGDPGTFLTAHPHPSIPGVEMPTGSLGHGLALGIGFALGHRLRGHEDRRCYVILGDGELQEGSVWEAASVAASQGLENLIAIVDRNRLQISGPTDQIASLEPLTERWSAFGWNVRTIDGHDLNLLPHALGPTPDSGRPTVWIADTVKGHGVPEIAGDPRSHFARLGEHQHRRTLASVRRAHRTVKQ